MSLGRGIVSYLQAKRLHQQLANAHRKLDEYEELLASLYDRLETIQSLACENCRVNFEQFASADFVATSVHPPSSTAFPQQRSGSCMDHDHHAHVYSRSRNTSAASLMDGLSQRTMSPSSNIPHQPNPTFFPSNYDGQQQIYLQAPSISSRSSSAASNHDDQYLYAPTISSEPSSSVFNHGDNQPPHLDKPVLSKTDDPSSSYGWSIFFDQGIKQSIDVKLEGVLDFKEVVSCVKFSPDGKYLAAGLDSGQTHLYDMKLGKMACVLAELSLTHLLPRRDRVWVINFSPDNKYLATGNQSFIIRIWDIAKKHVRNIFKHEAGVSGVDFSPNGRFVISAAHDGKIRSWSMRDGSCRIYSDTDAMYYSLRRTPAGRHIVAADYDGKLHVLDSRTGQHVEWKGHDGPGTISIMPDGMGFVTGSWDKTAKYWDLSFLGATQTGTLKLNEILRYTGHTNVVRGITVLADGKWIITISEDLTVQIWDSQTASRQCTMNGHERDIWWVDASPAGHYFASGGNDGRVAIWRCNPV